MAFTKDQRRLRRVYCNAMLIAARHAVYGHGCPADNAKTHEHFRANLRRLSVTAPVPPSSPSEGELL